ncbi:MAG: MMPL family transporter, partial [Alphaproteobacteria bacterium]
MAGAAAARARWTVALVLVLTALLGALAVPRLGIDTGTDDMIDADVPFRQNEIAFERAFPHLVDLLVIVVDGATAADAERMADALARRLAAEPALFGAVRRPDSLPFLEDSGVLYLPLATVAD